MSSTHRLSRALLPAALVLATLAGCERGPRSSLTGVAGADSTLVTVSAHADVRRVPDIATLSTGVVTQGADANSAIRENSQRMNRVLEAVKKAGVAAKDVQTSGVSLNPDYHYVSNRPPRIRGYYASNTVNVTVRDIGGLGGILDALVATGANQINGPMFDIDDKDAALEEARGKALAKSRQRAEQYARRLGLKVRRVVSIDETGGRARPVPVYARAVMAETAANDAAAAPVAPGQNVLGLSLDVVYELGAQ